MFPQVILTENKTRNMENQYLLLDNVHLFSVPLFYFILTVGESIYLSTNTILVYGTWVQSFDVFHTRVENFNSMKFPKLCQVPDKKNHLIYLIKDYKPQGTL